MNFNKSDLEKYLRYISKNFRVIPLRDYDAKPGIILRHDLDLDIRDAYEVYKLEKKHGLKSTFFVMVTSYFYNPLNQTNRQMLKEMAVNGFEIGLHFDPTIYGSISRPELLKKAKYEAEILESITRQKVVSISQHRPTLKNHNGTYLFFKDFRNTYDKNYFSHERYISDSRMRFLKDIYEFSKKGKGIPIQVLLHPFHFTREGETYEEKLFDFINETVEIIDKDFRVISTYKQTMRNKKLTDRIQKFKDL